MTADTSHRPLLAILGALALLVAWGDAPLEAAPPDAGTTPDADRSSDGAIQASLEQSFRAPKSPKVGTPLELHVRVTHPPRTKVRFDPVFKETRWELAETRRQTSTGEQRHTTEFHLTFQIFRTGEATLPPLEVDLERPDGTNDTLRTDPVTVTIGSVLEGESAPTFYHRRPPVSIPVEDYTIAWIGGGTLGVALLVLALLGWRRRRETDRSVDEPPRRPADVVALETLDAIEKAGHLERGELVTFYVRVSEAVREYLGRRYDFPGLEWTTAEILERLDRLDWPDTLDYETVEAWFRHVDMVKFSGWQPPTDRAETTLEGARAIVETVSSESMAPRPPEPDRTDSASNDELDSRADGEESDAEIADKREGDDTTSAEEADDASPERADDETSEEPEMASKSEPEPNLDDGDTTIDVESDGGEPEVGDASREPESDPEAESSPDRERTDAETDETPDDDASSRPSAGSVLGGLEEKQAHTSFNDSTESTPGEDDNRSRVPTPSEAVESAGPANDARDGETEGDGGDEDDASDRWMPPTAEASEAEDESHGAETASGGDGAFGDSLDLPSPSETEEAEATSTYGASPFDSEETDASSGTEDAPSPSELAADDSELASEDGTHADLDSSDREATSKWTDGGPSPLSEESEPTTAEAPLSDGENADREDRDASGDAAWAPEGIDDESEPTSDEGADTSEGTDDETERTSDEEAETSDADTPDASDDSNGDDARSRWAPSPSDLSEEPSTSRDDSSSHETREETS